MLFTLARKYKRVSTLLRSREFRICSARQVEHLLRILEALSFWYARFYWFVKCLTIFLPSSKFGRLVRRKAFLLCKNPCGAGCDGGRVTSSQREKSPRKEISRGNLLCAESGLPSLSYPSTREYSKVREHAQLVQPSAPGSSGVPEGPLPLCFRKSPEKNLLKGFLWATSSRRLDTALLCAAKKRGVE